MTVDKADKTIVRCGCPMLHRSCGDRRKALDQLEHLGDLLLSGTLFGECRCKRADMKAPLPAVSDEAAAGSEAASLAKLGGMAVTLALAPATLQHLPPVVVLILWLALGFVAGVPLAANAAVARGHALKTMSPTNPLHRLWRSGVPRVLLCGAFGICAAGILLVRLSEGGLAAWIGAVAGGTVVLAVMRSGGGMSARLNAPVHDAARLRRVALWLGMATTALASGMAGGLMGPGEPALERSVASALVAEAFQAHRFLDGILAWALGTVAALDFLPPLVETLLAGVVLAMSGAGVSALAVAALIPAADWARGVAIASDAPETPGPHRSALLAAAILTGLALVGALRVELWLSAQVPAARPVAQLQTLVERIGMTFHPAGTHATITSGREALAARDAAALAEVRSLAEAGFDAMADQVDPFLDGYYSIWAEYGRIGVAAIGLLQGDAEAAMEAHLEARLAVTLDSETHWRAITDRLDTLGLAEAYAAQEARESELAYMQITGLNPARLRLVAEFPAFAPLPELGTFGLSSSLEARLGASVAAGLLGAVVARRVVERLVQRGALRLAARALLAAIPLLGPAIALAGDAAALKLEEHFNRSDFRAEVLNALEEQRAEVLQLLDAAADAYAQGPAHALQSSADEPAASQPAGN